MLNALPWDPFDEGSLWNQYQKNHRDSASYQSFVLFFQASLSRFSLPEFCRLELNAMRAFNESLEHVDKVSMYLFYLLCIAGGMYALCSGFDGMVSVLSVFCQELYTGFVIALAALSALSALGIFIARDKPSILESLDLSSHQYQSMMDEYIFSLQIYVHQKKQEILHQTLKPTQELFDNLRSTSLILKQMLIEKRDINEQIKNTWIVYLQSNFAMFIGGVLFCSDGFFVGENVASFFLSQSFNLGLALSLSVALFALASYCYVECSSLKEYLYDRLFTDQLMTRQSLKENNDDYAFFELIAPGL